MSLSLGLGLNIAPRSAGFNPVSLFAGAQGLLIDPYNIGSMSQDTGGATPVTAAADPVGRILDLSGNANHPTQATNKPTYRLLDGRPCLLFDGTNDAMATPSITWGTDEVTIVAAVRKLSDAARGEIVEGVGSTGIFRLEAPASAAANFSFGQQGANATARASTVAGQTSPITRVISGVGKLGTPSSLLRVDGVAGTPNTDATGGGNFAASVLHIGSRQGSSLFFNGYIFALFAINRLLTASELTLVERWAGSRCGVTI